MPPASLWTPRDDGIPASIWLPGGAEPADGPTCTLEAAAEITALENWILADNFSGYDETTLADHSIDLNYGYGAWEGTEYVDLVLLDGSAVNPTTDLVTNTLSTPSYTGGLCDDVVLSCTVGIFSEQNNTAEISFKSADGNHFITILIGTTAPGTYTLNVSIQAGNESYGWAFNELSIPYCTWVNISVNTDFYNGESTLVVDGELQQTLSTWGSPWDDSNGGLVSIGLNNDVATSMRVADVALNISGLV